MKLKKFFRRGSGSAFAVKVTTLDAELEFSIPYKATGRDLYDLVARTIGLRETWYFGLQFTDSKNCFSWLKLDKRVLHQDVPRVEAIPFIFLLKYYPEDVSEELIQEVTQNLFFLQVKQSILSEDIHCPPEMSVLLASYAVQANLGDLELYDNTPLVMEELLPMRVIRQYQMTPQMWEERIRVWYADHRGMTRDEAQMEYLKIAQDLGMYGVNYFKITNKKGTFLWLGVTSLGLNVYDDINKVEPKLNFPWSEIRNIRVDDKKFNIKPTDRSAQNFIFYSKNNRMNKLILDLCIGNHDLYKKRRKPDTIEIQQMKQTARDEKRRRQLEKDKLSREKMMREEAERQKVELERRLFQYQEEMREANEALKRSEESSELLLEKSQIADEESRLLTQKSIDTENELQRLKLLSTKTHEEKVMLEMKVRETEQMVSTLLVEGEKRTGESDRLKNDLRSSRVAETQAKKKLLDFVESFKSTMQESTSNLNTSAMNGTLLSNSHLYQSTPHIAAPPPYRPNGGLAYGNHGNSASMDFGLLAGGSSTNSSLDLIPTHNEVSEQYPPALMSAPMLASGAAFERNNLLRKSVDTSLLYTASLLNRTRLNQTLAVNQERPPNGHYPVSHPSDDTLLEFSTTLNDTMLENLDGTTLGQTLDATALGCTRDATLFQADVSLFNDTDVDQLTQEIEKEKTHYLQKSKTLQSQLKELRNEIEGLKVDDSNNVLDKMYDDQREAGENKYSTLQRTRSGCTKSRIAFFEEL